MSSSLTSVNDKIINTLEIDKDYAFLYERYVNGKNVLIVDDSITYGQSIRNAIHAIAQAYVPKSVSVLTMFSQFWNNNGEEDEYKIKRFFVPFCHHKLMNFV